MPARQSPNPQRIVRELHVGVTQAELDQMHRLAARLDLPIARLIRAKLRVPSDCQAAQRIWGEEVAAKVAWHLDPPDHEGPLTVYVGRPKR